MDSLSFVDVRDAFGRPLVTQGSLMTDLYGTLDGATFSYHWRQFCYYLTGANIVTASGPRLNNQTPAESV